MKKLNLIFILLFVNIQVFSQNVIFINPVTTAIPILNVTPNAGERGMAEIGVVSFEDNYEPGLFQNPALLSRNKKVFGVKLSYMPWMRNLVKDMNVLDFGTYYSINRRNSIAFNFFYFNTGTITFPEIHTYIGYECYMSIKYAHSFSERFSFGVSPKFIVSNFYSNLDPLNKLKIKSIAGDIGFDYRNKIVFSDKKKLRYDIGLTINNLGPKISYSDDSPYKDFIPTNLKIGTMWTYQDQITKERQINYSIAYQTEKLLVPTPPIYENNVILYGKDPNVSALTGIFQSFFDAPYGFEEEMHEIIHKFGGEIKYKPDNETSYAFRGGYFYEHFSKGSRQFGTAGIGFKYKYFYLDFAYIISSRQNPYANTMNINIGFQKSLN